MVNKNCGQNRMGICRGEAKANLTGLVVKKKKKKKKKKEKERKKKMMMILTAYVKYTTINLILLGDGIQRRIFVKTFEHLF